MKRFLSKGLISFLVFLSLVILVFHRVLANADTIMQIGYRDSNDQYTQRTSFNRGDIIQAWIGGVPAGNGTRELAIFRSDTPNHPYDTLIITMFDGQGCQTSPSGVWGPGTLPVYHQVDSPNCSPGNNLALTLKSDTLDCSASGATCTIRLSKLNESFADASNAQAHTEQNGVATFSLSFDAAPPPGTARQMNFTLNPTSTTAGNEVTMTMNDLAPSTAYTVTVEWKGTTDPYRTLTFSRNSSQNSADKPDTTGKAFRIDDNEWYSTDAGHYVLHIKTDGFNCNSPSTQPADCTVRLKGTNGQEVTKKLTIKPLNIAFNPPPNAKWGEVKYLTARFIPRPAQGEAKYTIALKQAAANVNKQYTVTVKSDGTCSISEADGDDGNKGGVFVNDPVSSACQFDSNGNVFNVRTQVNTMKLPQPRQRASASNNSLFDVYDFILTTSQGTTVTKKFGLTKGTTTIEMKPSQPFTPDPNDSSRQLDPSKYKSEFYEGSNVDISVKGCPAGTQVGLVWWKGKDSVELTKKDESKYNLKTYDDFDYADSSDNKKIDVNASGVATLPNHQFGANNNSLNTPYFMRAWCLADKNSGVAATVDFRVWDSGKEFLTVPTDIMANTKFDITAGGLENECYYILLWNSDEKDTDDGSANYITGGDVQACSEKEDSDIDIPRRDKYLAKSHKWAPSSPVSVPNGLPAGHYKAKLFIPDDHEGTASHVGENCSSDDLCDDGKAEVEFCVEVCRNDGQEFPPGKAPCLIGTDKEGNVVDARPESEQKDNPYKYTNKDGKTVTAKPGTRDDILTCTVVPTAFGNIDTSPQGIVKSLLQILLSVAGSIALILIIIAGYKIMTSRGNPEQIQDAKEQLTSAIVGLLFIIFSVVILQTIGVDLLHIPGFKP